MKKFTQLLKESITSSTGNNIILYFETGQGSKYLITDKGETKRWKSEHANTGGDDKGLKEWYQNSFFVDPKFEYEANSILFLFDKEIKCALNIKNNKVTIYVLKDNKWVIGNMLDAYPKAGKDKPLVFDCINNPTIGHSATEYILNNDKFSIKKYHFGSPVTKILPIEKLDKTTLDMFIKK